MTQNVGEDEFLHVKLSPFVNGNDVTIRRKFLYSCMLLPARFVPERARAPCRPYLLLLLL